MKFHAGPDANIIISKAGSKEIKEARSRYDGPEMSRRMGISV